VVRVARRFVAGEMGNLKVGFSSSAAYAIMPAILRTFRTRFPEVTLTLEERSTEEQLALLAVHQLDVGFVRLPVENAPVALTFKTIVREPLILALPHKHRLGRRRTVPMTALGEEPFIVVARQAAPGLYDQIEMLCRRAGFKPRVARQAMEIQTIVGLVSAGLGIAIVPASVRGLQGGGVVYRPLAPASAFTEMALVHNRENHSAALGSFLDTVSDFTQRR
jgi:DNA-binding transcriptional LysR family regulator